MSQPKPYHPVEIQESLRSLRFDYPDPSSVAFVMMRFSSDAAYVRILNAIRSALDPFGIAAVRADDKEYHDDLFANVLTYVYGCGFGVAVFERISSEDASPNVALELGYMFALRKPCCLLKDRTLQSLPTDLVGKLYHAFDPYDPAGTIPPSLSRFLRQKGLSPLRTPQQTASPLSLNASEAAKWTPEDLESFFLNLERDARNTAYRELEQVPMREPEKALHERTRELVRRQVTAYGLLELYEAWKQPNRLHPA